MGWHAEAEDLRPVRACGVLTVHLLSATGLQSEDLFGASDPYCEMVVQHRSRSERPISKKTRWFTDTLFPVWNETHEFDIDSKDGKPVWVGLRIFDHDVRTKDDLLGVVAIAAPAGESHRVIRCILPLEGRKNAAGFIKSRRAAGRPSAAAS